MPATYSAPVRDTAFVLETVVGLEKLARLPRFADATPDVVRAILEEGGRFAEEVLHPLNAVGDREGCTRDADGSVATPEGFQQAYQAFVEGGWNTLTADKAFGGQGLPFVVGVAFDEYVSSANMAFGMYPGLTKGAIPALAFGGSEELKALYLPHLVSGRWTATMNLTEPHAGTDLGLLRTRAVPNADGSWAITGSKIFISAGEHDLAENIVHLVLAKTPGAPDSSKGISLFLVPKFLGNADGTPGARNEVSCGALEHKMGIHGNATCAMNFDGATGWLIGEEMRGLAVMFVMMNMARLGVGVQGMAQAEIATQNAARYARERLQGRALSGPKAPDQPADPIIVHPDVRRMLLNAKAFNEGARALMLWVALQADLAEGAGEAAEREVAGDLLALLTPVIKAFFTDEGYAHATAAQQVFGGHGYIVETGAEQFVRDARITMIYEGANGIQAMDLVGRKLAQHGGRALRSFLGIVRASIDATAADTAMRAHADSLQWAVGKLEGATMWLMQHGLSDPEEAGAAAMPYLRLLALVAMGHMWLTMAKAAEAQLADRDADRPFLEAKLITARHFFTRRLPEAGALAREISAGGKALMELPADAF